MPAPHDPDSFIKENGPEAFQALIDGAEGFFDFYLRLLCEENDLGTDLGRSTVVKSMGEAVRKTSNSVVIDRYAQQTALRLGVSPDAMRAEFAKTKPARPPRPNRWEETESFAETEADTGESFDAAEPEIARPSPKEFWLLKLLLIDEEAPVEFAPCVNLQWISHPQAREIVDKILKAHAENAWRGPAALLSAIEDSRAQALASEAMAEQRKIPDPKAQVADILLTLRNQYIDRELASLNHLACQPDTPDEKQEEIMRLQQDWKRMKRDPLIPPAP